MREINKIAEGLFEKIRDRFEDVSLGNDNAKATTDPQKARFFNFDYVVDDTNHGNITMSLIDEISLKVYFSKNISSDLDDEQKKEWYSFLRELREFARRNLLSFEPRDITRSTLKHRDIQQQSKADSTYDADEVVAESRMYGTLNRSYESFGPVRIKLQHTKPIMDETHGARSRNIAAVFVENDQGERFRLPFENLTGARAMARHVSAGGVPTDELGRHITEMVGEMTTLRPFVRGMARRTFEDAVTKEMVESAFGYHALLKNTLKKLKGKRGYTEFKESFKPALVEDEANVAELKELFVKKTLDERIEQALPLVHKAYHIMKENNNPYAQQFENWADKLSEGSWALPDTDDEVDQLIEWLSEEHPVGVDAQDATNSLYNIIGDDRLFDRLGELAKTDPTADARDVVTSWLYDNLPQVYQRIESEIGDPDYPAEPAEDGEQEVDESYTPPPVMINGKQVDLRSIELDGVESWDQPDYADAYASAATFTDGTDLTDDELEELSDQHGDIINMRAHDMLEGNTYGSGDGSLDSQVNEDDDKDPKEESRESAQAAIIRRIMNSHTDALMHYGPKLIADAVEQYAYNLDDLDEIGTSDVSIWTEHVLEILNDMDMQKQDDREEYQQHYAGNDTENDPQVRNTEFEESKDKISYDPKTGKLTGWEHEGDWKKSKGKEKDPVGKIHNLSDKARRETEKMSEDETLEEAFERALGESYDTRDAYELEDPKHPDFVKNYEEYKSTHPDAKLADFIAHLRSRKVSEGETLEEAFERLVNEADSRFMSYLEPLVGQEVYIPGEGTTGTVVGPSPNPKLPTGIQVKLSNGQLITTGPGLFKASKPGLVQQAIDKLNSLTGKIDPVSSVAKPYGTVAGPMDNLHKQDWSGVKEDILKLAGLK